MRTSKLFVPVMIAAVAVIAASTQTSAQTSAQAAQTMAQIPVANFATFGKVVAAPYQITANVKAGSCPELKTIKPAKVVDDCAGDDKIDGTKDDGNECLAYDTSKPLSLVSDLCRNQANNAYVRDANGKPVSYTFFGASDCRAYKWSRSLAKIEQVYIHNGGSGRVNRNTWTCRPAASHYTIDRDGTIHQHIGEERPAPHVKGDNALTLGIELQTTTTTGDDTYKTGTRCNSLSGKSRSDVEKACTPTAKQYQSLRNLLSAIASRTAVKIDEDHLVGHCEVEDGVHDNGHADPKSFDWREIGLSNSKKLASLKGKKTMCGTYDYYP